MQSQPVRPEILKREKEAQLAKPVSLVQALNLTPDLTDIRGWFKLLLWPIILILIVFLYWFSTVSYPSGAFMSTDLPGYGVLAVLLTYFAIMKGIDPLVDTLTFFGCSSQIPSYFLSENTLSVCNLARGFGYFVIYWFVLWAWIRFFEAWSAAAKIRDASYGPLGLFGGISEAKREEILEDTNTQYRRYLQLGSVILFVYCMIFLQPMGSKDAFNLVVSELQVMGFNRMEALSMAIKEHVRS